MHLVNHDVWMKELRGKLPVLADAHAAVQAALPVIAAAEWPGAAGKASLERLKACVDGLLVEWGRVDLNSLNLTLNAAEEAVDAEGEMLDANGQRIQKPVAEPVVEPALVTEPAVG